MEQLDIFGMMYEKYKIPKDKKFYMIEAFGGYGSQRLSYKYLFDKDVDKSVLIEWSAYSSIAYHKLHSTDNFDYSSMLSKSEIVDYLLSKGISLDWNKPAERKELERRKESFLRETYNAIISTNNLVDISKVKGEDLCVENRNDYCVCFCYSFPCQDLSLAGKMLGFQGDRSSLLFQVERVLYELKELNQLPNILLLENVSQLHNETNKPFFYKFLDSLEELGYESYWDDLNAKDYGMPQNRIRTFVISILSDNQKYSYTFPRKRKLKHRLKDLLEDEVDEKYYLSQKQIEDIQQWNAYEKPLEAMEKTNKKNISPTLTTRSGAYAAGMILVKNATKQGYLEAEIGDGIDISSRMEYYRGTVQNGMTQTITTMGGDNNGVVVPLKRGYSCEVKSESNNPDGIDYIGNYSKSDYNQTSIVGKNGIAPTMTENHGQVTAIVEEKFKNAEPILVGGIGEMKSNGGTQFYQQDRIYSSSSSSSISVTTSFNPFYKNNLAIRKLTCRECFRLMGVINSDIDKIQDLPSSVQYHLAGDSIVTFCLISLFGTMTDIDYEQKITDLLEKVAEKPIEKAS